MTESPSRNLHRPHRLVAGFLLLVVSGCVWWWNEARAPEMGRASGEAARQVVPIAGEQADPANNGRLVQLTGLAESKDRLVDPLFGIEEIAIALIREVEMFQWHERSGTVTRGPGSGEESGVVYSYKPEWSDRLIDSNAFVKATQHSNPAFFPVRSEIWRAENVAVGAFRLNALLISQITEGEYLPLTDAHAARLPERFARRSDARQDGWLYIGDPIVPSIGDLRVRIRVVRDQPVSVLARQLDNTFEPHITARGVPIEYLASGTLNARVMFEQLGREISLATWALRILVLIAMVTGLGLVLHEARERQWISKLNRVA
jgi:hypothetical protein